MYLKLEMEFCDEICGCCRGDKDYCFGWGEGGAVTVRLVGGRIGTFGPVMILVDKTQFNLMQFAYETVLRCVGRLSQDQIQMNKCNLSFIFSSRS